MKVYIGAGAEVEYADQGYILLDDLSDFEGSVERLQEYIDQYYGEGLYSGADLIRSGAYLIHDVEKRWPFEDNSVDEVYSYRFIGRGYSTSSLHEAFRVLKPGGTLKISAADDLDMPLRIIFQYCDQVKITFDGCEDLSELQYESEEPVNYTIECTKGGDA